MQYAKLCNSYILSHKSFLNLHRSGGIFLESVHRTLNFEAIHCGAALSLPLNKATTNVSVGKVVAPLSPWEQIEENRPRQLYYKAFPTFCVQAKACWQVRYTCWMQIKSYWEDWVRWAQAKACWKFICLNHLHGIRVYLIASVWDARLVFILCGTQFYLTCPIFFCKCRTVRVGYI